MSAEKILEKIHKLINEIRYYDYMYYIKNTSVVSNTDYDLIKQQLENLEAEYPELIQENSPTYMVGFKPSFDFPLQKHSKPMLSLKNSYLLEEVIKYINKEHLWPVVIEPKIDGISLSLIYINGFLNKGVLRGNGREGENILDHIMYTNIPFTIAFKESMEIRGELYISKNNFNIINEEKIKKKEIPFQNSRNATVAIVRNKKIEYTHFLDFIPYYLHKEHKNMADTQIETLKLLSQLGFKSQWHQLACREEELKEKINSLKDGDFDRDGVVIKTNDLSLMESLGNTNHHPKGAIAYKFTNNHKESKIINILWQVSRNGKITPIAEINPIILDNANIKKITLHNKKYAQINKLNIGAVVMVERVGSTVPQIKKVLETSEIPIHLETCPSCEEKTKEDDNNFFCINNNCPIQLQEKLYYFCQNLGVKGLGEKSIQQLSLYCKTPSQLLEFIITSKTINVIGWNKVCFKMEKVLSHITPIKLLTSLGVENLSEKSLSLILNFFQISTFSHLKLFLQSPTLLENLRTSKDNIKHIGEEKIKSFIEFVKNNSQEILNCMNLIK
jgi:DNA ligase (NAD+)